MTFSLAAALIFSEAKRKFSCHHGNYYSLLNILTERPIGSRKTVKGWIRSIRKMKNYIFINLTDGSCISSLQIILPKEICSEVQYGSAVNITGHIQANNNGTLELLAESYNVVGKCEISDNYPFTPKQKHPYDYYRKYLHLRPQVEYFSSMLRFRNAASLRIHNYFKEKEFVGIHTPIITSNDCEGAGETFSVKPHSKKLIQSMKSKKKNAIDESDETVFFNNPAFLTVSGQLHLEVIVRSIPRVYTFNPTFRAENSKSRLHLSEFYMIEAEEAFINDLNKILYRMESLIKDVTSFLLSKHLEEMKYMLNHNETNVNQHIKVLENILNTNFSVITFSEAKSSLKNNYHMLKKCDNITDHNLTKEEELFIVEKNNNIPIFVIDWPKLGKPFYMKESSENNELVKAVDLLVPNVGELCGGSLREDNFEILKLKLLDLQLCDSMQWYLDLRKFGSVPSGGFGMGFERLLQFLLNCGNIKDTIPFPRWPHGLQL